jgi:fumarate reductase subunit D
MTPEERRGRNLRRRRLLERWTKPADQWRANVQRWVDAGIVTQGQGDEILSVQQSDTPVDPSEPEVISSTQELLSYFALLVIALSSILYLSHYWVSIGRGGHLSVALLVAGDALLVGSTVVALGGGAARRLGGLLWLIATVGVATSVSDVMGTGPQHDGPRLLVVGLSLLVTSVLLWRNQNRPLQFLSAVTGFVLTMSGAATVGRVHATPSQLALFVCLCAFALGIASLQTLQPAFTALVVAVVASSVGSLALSFPQHLGGIVLGVVTTVIAAALGAVLVRPALIVIGALGFFMFDIRAFSIYVRSVHAALGAGVLGLLIVCVGLWHAAHREVRERRDARIRVPATVDNELLG